MPVDDLWYLKDKDDDGARRLSKRHGRGKRWRCRWIDDTGRERQRLFDRKVDADRHDANVRADVSRGVYVDPSAGKVTVADYGRQWRSTVLHCDSTAERAERAFRLHIEPILGGRALASVRPSHLQAWVRDRQNVLEPTTLRTVYSYLVAMFRAAARDRVIGITPCVGVRLPDVDNSDLVIPTADQVHALAKAVPARYESLVYFGAGTGARQGEAWGLELEHVDFDRGLVHIVQQLKQVAGRLPYLAAPKTKTSTRAVELGRTVMDALRRHLDLFPVVPVEIDDETDPRKPVRRKAKLIWLNSYGNAMNRPAWSRVWVPAVERAGLDEGFGFHGLRHYYATLLIHGGASVKTVQLALGHATPTITLNTYVGLWPDAIDQTRALVDAALSTRPVRRLAVVR